LATKKRPHAACVQEGMILDKLEDSDGPPRDRGVRAVFAAHGATPYAAKTFWSLS
jgi:hypothetical protein